MDIFVGRQPILTQDGDIYAYELLYRNSIDNYFPDIDSNKATIGLLVNTFLTIGIDQMAGERFTFINYTGEMLAQDIFSDLVHKKVVIEILEDVAITPSLLTRLRELKNAGFKLALDDFILQEQYVAQTELFRLVDYIKVDFLSTTDAERIVIEKFIKTYPEVTLLAEKIETAEQFNAAKKSGYKLFQGYYFAKPEVIKGVEIPANVNLQFQIIEQLNQETPNIDEIAELIIRDMSLSFKLLRFINTLAFNVPKQITSIKQALVLLGLKEVKKWMYILALHGMKEGAEMGRIQALVDYSLTRAKLCELLAKRTGKNNTEAFFLTGMFSLINVIMNRSWEEILQLIPLSEEVAQTLNGQQTEITSYLQLAKAVERFNWEQIGHLSEELGITKSELSGLSLNAHRWARKIE